MAGHFIVIDGPDGAGKGTQIELLKDVLPHRYARPPEDFVFTREPGGSPFAEKIRELILSPEAKHASGAVMIQLFGAARFDHLENTIVPALAADKVVISDRFDASTYAYQLFGQRGGEIENQLFATQRGIIDRIPCLGRDAWTTIILDIDAEMSKGRAARRRGKAHDHFDERSTSFYQAVRDGFGLYAQAAADVAMAAVVIDASRTPALVHHDVIDVFDRVLGGPSPEAA